MVYTIEYAGLCIQGLVRLNNEDNICCEDRYLPIVHTDDISGFSGSFCTGEGRQFAVFDGMGGEECGEVASHLAARTFGRNGNDFNGGFEEKAAALTRRMNRAILNYSVKNHIRMMGSTIASLFFEKDCVKGFNIGDSRCYHYDKDTLKRLSVDHTVPDPSVNAGSLTRCLGTSDPEKPLEPACYSEVYQEGGIFVLCTDGLTKLVSERRIASILKKKRTLAEKLRELKDLVLRKGAVDNTTIILFETEKRNRGFSGAWGSVASWITGK